MAEHEPASILIDIDRAETAATISVTGEIDLSTSAALVDAFDEVGAAEVVHLDLSGVEYMDSTGLRAVLSARAALEARGARLDVIRASSIVERLLEITGLGEMVTGSSSEPPVTT